MKLTVGDVVTLNFKSINNYGYYLFGVSGDSKLTVTAIDADPYIPGRLYVCLSDGDRIDVSVTETAIHKVVSKARKVKQTT